MNKSIVFFFIYQTLNQLFGLGIEASQQSFLKGIINLMITGWIIELIFIEIN